MANHPERDHSPCSYRRLRPVRGGISGPERQYPTRGQAVALPAGELVDVPSGARKWRHPPPRSSICPPRSSTPAASSSRTAPVRSSTTKPTTGPVEKCSWSWSRGPNTSNVPPSGSWKAAKSDPSWIVVGTHARQRLRRGCANALTSVIETQSGSGATLPATCGARNPDSCREQGFRTIG
jgi:hypothetical protein